MTLQSNLQKPYNFIKSLQTEGVSRTKMENRSEKDIEILAFGVKVDENNKLLSVRTCMRGPVQIGYGFSPYTPKPIKLTKGNTGSGLAALALFLVLAKTQEHDLLETASNYEILAGPQKTPAATLSRILTESGGTKRYGWLYKLLGLEIETDSAIRQALLRRYFYYEGANANSSSVGTKANFPAIFIYKEPEFDDRKIRQLYTEHEEKSEYPFSNKNLTASELFDAANTIVKTIQKPNLNPWSNFKAPTNWITQSSRIIHKTFGSQIPLQGKKNGNPYKDLSFYELSDSDKFYGRDDLTNKVCSIVLNEFKLSKNTPVITLIGGSGSGKSSLLRAGIAARLPQIEKNYAWSIVIFGPNDFEYENGKPYNIIRSILEIIDGQSTLSFPGKAIRDICKLDRSSPQKACKELARQLRKSSSQMTRKLVICIDQFEEIFDQLNHPFSAQYWLTLKKFINEVVNCPNCSLILTLESSRKSQFDTSPHFDNSIIDGFPVLVDGFSQDFLWEVISKPFEERGYNLGGGVIKSLLRTVQQLQDDSSPTSLLPLLSLKLGKIYDKLESLNIGEGESKVITEEVIGEDFTIDSEIEEIGEIAVQELQRMYPITDADISYFFRSLISYSENDGCGFQLEVATNLFSDYLKKIYPTFLRHKLIKRVNNSDQFKLTHEAVIRNWPRAMQWFNMNKHIMKSEAIFLAEANALSLPIPDVESDRDQAIRLAAEILICHSHFWCRNDAILSEKDAIIRTYCRNLFSKNDTPRATIKHSNAQSTYVHMAAMYGMVDLLEKYSRVDMSSCSLERSSDARTPLHMAAWYSTDSARFLVDEVGVDPALPDVDGWTPLSIAIVTGNFELFSLFLKHTKSNGLDLADKGNLHHVCSLYERVEMAKLLKESYHLDCAALDKHGNTPLHIAAIHGKAVSFDFYYDLSDPAHTTNYGDTLLHLAALRGNTEIIKLIANRKEELHGLENACRNTGETALMLAAKYWHADALEILIEISNPNQQIENNNESKGRTALHEALYSLKDDSRLNESLCAEAIKRLLKHPELDINIKDSNGKSAIDLAQNSTLLLNEILSSKN